MNKSRPRMKSKQASPPKDKRSASTAAKSRVPEPWTSRTIRLRKSTAMQLTMAACSQKTRQVKGKLNAEEPVTVQEIADLGIRLALVELGYQT